MRKPSQSDLDRVIRRTRSRFDRLVTQYAEGDINSQAFGDALLAILASRHARAGYLGRRRAGDMTPYGADDDYFGALVAEGQSHYVARLVGDLQASRYVAPDGTLREGALRRRARMYADRLTGSANEAFAGTSDTPIYWRLGPADHCDRCPELAAGSPYTSENLPTCPGACETPCLTACRCWLETEQAMGFRPTP